MKAHPLCSHVGAANPKAKLDDDKVLKIRKMLAADVPRRDIAARYGVSVSTIAWIADGRSWTHVKEPRHG